MTEPGRKRRFAEADDAQTRARLEAHLRERLQLGSLKQQDKRNIGWTLGELGWWTFCWAQEQRQPLSRVLNAVDFAMAAKWIAGERGLGSLHGPPAPEEGLRRLSAALAAKYYEVDMASLLLDFMAPPAQPWEGAAEGPGAPGSAAGAAAGGGAGAGGGQDPSAAQPVRRPAQRRATAGPDGSRPQAAVPVIVIGPPAPPPGPPPGPPLRHHSTQTWGQAPKPEPREPLEGPPPGPVWGGGGAGLGPGADAGGSPALRGPHCINRGIQAGPGAGSGFGLLPRSTGAEAGAGGSTAGPSAAPRGQQAAPSSGAPPAQSQAPAPPSGPSYDRQALRQQLLQPRAPGARASAPPPPPPPPGPPPGPPPPPGPGRGSGPAAHFSLPPAPRYGAAHAPQAAGGPPDRDASAPGPGLTSAGAAGRSAMQPPPPRPAPAQRQAPAPAAPPSPLFTQPELPTQAYPPPPPRPHSDPHPPPHEATQRSAWRRVPLAAARPGPGPGPAPPLGSPGPASTVGTGASSGGPPTPGPTSATATAAGPRGPAAATASVAASAPPRAWPGGSRQLAAAGGSGAGGQPRSAPAGSAAAGGGAGPSSAGAGAVPGPGGGSALPPTPRLLVEFRRRRSHGALEDKLRKHLAKLGNSKLKAYCRSEGVPWTLLDVAAYGVALRKLAPHCPLDWAEAVRFIATANAAPPGSPPAAPPPLAPALLERVASSMRAAAGKYDLPRFVEKQTRLPGAAGAGAPPLPVGPAATSAGAAAAPAPAPAAAALALRAPASSAGGGGGAAGAPGSPGGLSALQAAAGRIRGAAVITKRGGGGGGGGAAAGGGPGAGLAGLEQRLRTHLKRLGKPVTTLRRRNLREGLGWSLLDLVVLDRDCRLQRSCSDLDEGEAVRRLAAQRGQALTPELMAAVSAGMREAHAKFRLGAFVEGELAKRAKRRQRAGAGGPGGGGGGWRRGGQRGRLEVPGAVGGRLCNRTGAAGVGGCGASGGRWSGGVRGSEADAGCALQA
ncbi:hypothetical protein HYH03_012393 [Edaphochlamys debaryana]|uniref:Uncharacterized protein n=1 Tax=Edaphochlamys debaryana TaxID=47281 RepID=A0A835XQC1_9CHLO|nr:hypothetical protein HYH03_012393 [Edaphochlamys debaryana]|eukprot:KAG2489167.1 hypothetical protein HYH03_012393 [Edaphochlamys debaryana]